MEFGWDDDFEAFRAEVRDFIAHIRTPELERELAQAAEDGTRFGPTMLKIRDALDARGWVKMCWPKEMGGEQKSPWYQFILVEEFTRAEIPYGRGTASMIAPASSASAAMSRSASISPASGATR